MIEAANGFEAQAMLEAVEDIAFGTAGLDFNQDPPQGIAEAVFAPERLDSNLLDRLLSRCSDNLALLAAPAVLDRTVDLDEQGNRFNPNKVLFDPYSREITHNVYTDALGRIKVQFPWQRGRRPVARRGVEDRRPADGAAERQGDRRAPERRGLPAVAVAVHDDPVAVLGEAVGERHVQADTGHQERLEARFALPGPPGRPGSHVRELDPGRGRPEQDGLRLQQGHA